MSEFCELINFAVESRQFISTRTSLDAMASLLYRLVDMHFELNSTDETIRLTLLAFCCSVFLQWNNMGMVYAHLSSAFRTCFRRLPSSKVSPELQLWALMVGGVSVLESVDDKWLRPLLAASMECCEISSWENLRQLLESIMWINLVHDRPGKRTFDHVTTSSGY